MTKKLYFRLALSGAGVMIGTSEGDWVALRRPASVPEETWKAMWGQSLLHPHLAGSDKPTFLVREWGDPGPGPESVPHAPAHVREVSITLGEIRDEEVGLAVMAAYDPLNRRWYVARKTTPGAGEG